MPSGEEIRLMTRLAMLEQGGGRELKKIRESYKSDYIGIPMVKNALRMSAVFVIVLGIWAACQMDFILIVVAQMETMLLGIGVLTAYLMVLLVILLVTYLTAASRYYRSLSMAQEYQELLVRLQEIRGRGQ